MSRLSKDFGVSALIGTEIVTFSFGLIFYALAMGIAQWDDIMVVIGAWVGGVVGGYFAIKAGKVEKENLDDKSTKSNGTS